MWGVPAVVLALACREEPEVTPPPPLDLAQPLGPGEVRGGVLLDESPLFGGISAEARPGDVLLYNDRARFVIQSPREGNYYVLEGGGVIDADIVRPSGQPGRDAVEEWSTMFGLGRLLIPESLEILSDGQDGSPASVRVSGYEGPLHLIEGTLETPGFIPTLGLEVEITYTLPPDSYLLEVTSTARATDKPAPIAIGDVLIGADEALDAWTPGSGYGEAPSTPRPWSGYRGKSDDVAYVIAAGPGEQLQVSGYELLTELTSMIVGFAPSVTLQPGEETTWTRYYGVGPDLATLSGEVLSARGEQTQLVEGTISADDGPVQGAQVVLDVAGAPYTVALTDESGRYEALLPAGGAVSALPVGRGTGRSTDLPAGAAYGSPYAAPSVRESMLDALQGGALPVPLVQGRGVGADGRLGVPGVLVVETGDGLPFMAQLSALSAPPETDEARVSGRPDGRIAQGWSKDGGIEMQVEPGSYSILVSRGPRFELFEQTVEIAPGEQTLVSASLPLAFEAPGWLLGDPHSHASPSSDGAIPMEERLIVSAASGVQVHFGTDHDHIADYRPLLEPLGLQGVITSIVADEVSPPLRGHFNIYPVTPDEALPDGGAWLWWSEIPSSTEDMVDRLRARHGDLFVLQSNHPTDSGLGSSAGWSVGAVASPEMWTSRIEAVEVLNSGDHEEFFPFWLDLVLRGQMVTPVGVSDSHSHTGGHIGISATWLDVGADVTSLSDEAVADAIRSGRVSVSRGPMLLPSLSPGTLSGGGALHVEALAASYVHVDRISLLRDGEVVEVVEGSAADFDLSADKDALFVVVAEGDTPMLPLSGLTPWAMVGPYRLDLEGNGWEPPLPPLSLGL